MEKKASKINKVGRILYLIFIGLFFLSVLVQIFIAGLAIFVNPAHWLTHTSFVHLFGFSFPVVLLVCAYIGKMPKWANLHAFALIFFVYGMYFTANFTEINRIVGAMHPLIAFILVFISYQSFEKTILFIKNER